MSFFNLKDTIEYRYHDYAESVGASKLAVELITWSEQQGFEKASNGWVEFVDPLLGIRICFKIKSFLFAFTIHILDHANDTWEEYLGSDSLDVSQKIINEQNITMFMSAIQQAVSECPVNLL